jgi:hypothetical protein
MSISPQEYLSDKDILYKELVKAGAIPSKKNSFHCFLHKDRNPSSWIKKSAVSGRYYWTCAPCGVFGDALWIEATNRGIDPKELFKEKFGKEPQYKVFYKTLDELINDIDGVVTEVNPYTNPNTNNLDLITIRYYERGEAKKKFVQAHQSKDGFVKRKPDGKLPLFNRTRIATSSSIIFVEGEGCVRKLTELGFTATTAAGGSKNATNTDYSPLQDKTVILWADLDLPGTRYIEEVAACLSELESPPKVFKINPEGFELPEGSDVVDLYDKILAEGGVEDDVIGAIHSLIEEAEENNPLAQFEEHLEDMREGRYVNLPIKDFPILTSEAKMLLNKRLGVVYGAPKSGKTLFVGKLCDDLTLAGYKVARLVLEDELTEHLKRSLAQQTHRAELAKEEWHRANPLASKVLYEENKELLGELIKTIVAGEDQEWTAEKGLAWIDAKLSQGYDLVVIDPVSAFMTENVWITSHKLVWGAKRILSKYPNGRVLFVSHSNAEGNVAGGMAFKRFSHAMFMTNFYKVPKEVMIANRDGEMETVEMKRSIGIETSRYGAGQGLELVTTINPDTLCLDEVGVVLEVLDKKSRKSNKTEEYYEVQI